MFTDKARRRLKSKAVSRAVSLKEWLAFDKSYPAPTFHARPPLALAFSSLDSNMVPEPLQVVVDDNAKVMIPMMRMAGGRLPWKVYAGMPWGCYSVVLREDGQLADGDVTKSALSRLIEAGVSRLEINLWPLAPTCQLGGFSHETHETSVIDLADGAESVFKQMAGTSRRAAEQALRRGVKCDRETDSTGVETFYNLLSQAAGRWRLPTPLIPKRLFEAIVHYGANDVEVWIARQDGEAIAGSIILYGASEANVFSAARRSETAALNPHNILNVVMMRSAAERGMRWYNLGGSGGLPGVKKFKQHLGATTANYTSNVYEQKFYKTYRLLRAAMSNRR